MMNLEQWANEIQSIANRINHGKYGDERAFIYSVWQEAKKEGLAGPLDFFKDRLVEANRDGYLRLHRADLVSAMDPDLVRMSEHQYLNATFHFVETAKPTKAKPTKAKPTKAKPTKSKPTKAKPTKAKPTKAKAAKTAKAKAAKAAKAKAERRRCKTAKTKQRVKSLACKVATARREHRATETALRRALKELAKAKAQHAAAVKGAS